MNKPALLIIDDEQEILNALNRVLRKDFQLFLFADPILALEFYRDQPVPLILSDMRMPGMDGATLLGHISDINPNSKRFLLTGHADINLTVAAVNEGKISHYFAKPWDNYELMTELKNAFDVYMSEINSKKLLRINKEKNAKLALLNSSMELKITKSDKKLALASSKELKNFARLKKIFNTFVGIYANSIALHNQEYTKHNYRIAAQARFIAEQQGCDKILCFQIYIAGLLYEAGKLALPQTLLQHPYELLNHQDQSQFDSFYQLGADLISQVDELSYIVEIIKNIPVRYNNSGLSDNIEEHEIPLGSRILAIVINFDNLVIGRQTALPLSVVEAKIRLEKLSGNRLDPVLISKFSNMLTTLPKSLNDGTLEFAIDISQLHEGYILSQDIVNHSGQVLITSFTVITQSHINKIVEISTEHNEIFSIFIQSVS